MKPISPPLKFFLEVHLELLEINLELLVVPLELSIFEYLRLDFYYKQNMSFHIEAK